MRALFIIVEGQTEEEFVNNSLAPYLQSYNIHDVRAIKIQTSMGHKGGDLRYARYRPDAIHLLKSQQDIFVTSLIDFYKLRNDFPKYEEAKNIANPIDRVTFLEQAIKGDINHSRFIPYIQLHEFEGLLFTGREGFRLLSVPRQSQTEIIQILQDYPNPELINDGETTAPSKRLKRLIPGYKKTFHGPLIALENGLPSILQSCPRFRTWVETLVEVMQR